MNLLYSIALKPLDRISQSCRTYNYTDFAQPEEINGRKYECNYIHLHGSHIFTQDISYLQ